jgi:hypothetical protein
MKLIIRKINITGHSPSDIFPIYTCEVCFHIMIYKDIWIVEDMDYFIAHSKYIMCCSEVCGEMAILQNI